MSAEIPMPEPITADERIAADVTREVVFTDYGIHDDARIEVVVSEHDGEPIANIRMPAYPLANFCGGNDIREPDLLRSYAHAMLKAAAEMERMAR